MVLTEMWVNLGKTERFEPDFKELLRLTKAKRSSLYRWLADSIRMATSVINAGKISILNWLFRWLLLVSQLRSPTRLLVANMRMR